MNTIDKISNLLKEQNKKQKDLTDYLGISQNAFTDWKSGRIKSYVKHIPKIAVFFGVTTDYLLGREDNPSNNEVALNLNRYEQKLIDDFRKLNRQGQEYILQTMDMAIDKYKKADNFSDMENTIGL